jgi:hypothetical protein
MEWLGLRTLSFTECPNAVVLLREIDQVKVGAERPHELEQPPCRLLLYPLHQRFVRPLPRPQLNSRLPDMLDVVEQLSATLLPEDLTNKLAKQPNVIP